MKGKRRTSINTEPFIPNRANLEYNIMHMTCDTAALFVSSTSLKTVAF